jgi:hypothetical protein
MKHYRPLYLLLAIAVILARGIAVAQSATPIVLPAPGAIPPENLLTVDGGKVWLTGRGLVPVPLVVTSHATTAITITAVGSNPVLFTPIPPVSLRPGERKAVDGVMIDMAAANFPLTGPVVFLVDDGTGTGAKSVRTIVTFASKDVVMLNAKMLRWDVGETPLPKTVQITNVPAGARVIGAKALNANAGFDVAFHDNAVSVTPKTTAAMAAVLVQIETNPASSRPVTLMAYVMSPPSGFPKAAAPRAN